MFAAFSRENQHNACDGAFPLETPKPRNDESNTEETQKWLSGIDRKVTQKWLKSDSKVTKRKRLLSHFCVTLIVLGFGGSLAGKAHHKTMLPKTPVYQFN